MSGLTEEIKNQEEAIDYARSDPNKALGVLIWNYLQFQQQYKEDKKKNKVRNVAVQSASGVAGGAAAVWAFMHLYWADLVEAAKAACKGP